MKTNKSVTHHAGGNVPENIVKRMLAAYDTEQTALNTSIIQFLSETDAKRNETQSIAARTGLLIMGGSLSSPSQLNQETKGRMPKPSIAGLCPKGMNSQQVHG